MAKLQIKTRLPRNHCLCDTETTGLYPGLGFTDENGKKIYSGEIIQLAAVGIDGASLEKHSAGTFYALIKPQNPEFASQQAIAVVGEQHFNDACTNGLDPKTAFLEFDSWCRKLWHTKHVSSRPFFTAFNSGFDRRMLSWAFHHYGIVEYDDADNYAWGTEFDLMNLAYILWESDPSMANFKLDTVLEKLGMKRSGGLHGALEDVLLSAEFLQRAQKFIREASSKMVIKLPRESVKTPPTT